MIVVDAWSRRACETVGSAIWRSYEGQYPTSSADCSMASRNDPREGPSVPGGLTAGLVRPLRVAALGDLAFATSCCDCWRHLFGRQQLLPDFGMRPAGGVVGFGQVALGIGLEQVEQDRQHGVEMRAQRASVAAHFIRELIDVRLCMLLPCLSPGLIFGGPALLYLAPEGVEFTRCLTEMVGEEFTAGSFSSASDETFRQRRLVKGGENARWVQPHPLGQVHQQVELVLLVRRHRPDVQAGPFLDRPASD